MKLSSLRSQITLITVAVATVAVLVTGLASLQLVRATTTEQARAQLAAQVQLLSRIQRIATVSELGERASVALGDTVVALVRANGDVQGAAAEYLTPAVIETLRRGDSVSTTGQGEGGLAMVEGRPAPGGASIVLARPLSSIDGALRESTRRILFSLAVGLVVAVLGGALLARRLARPLSDTAMSARRLAGGERGIELPRPTTTELATVTEALAALDVALRSSEGRQREFLQSISHDLRTPLTAVRGYAEAIADGMVEPAALASVGATLVAETERLDRFVADLLELARLEADDFRITTGQIDVAALLREVAEAWRGLGSTLGVELEVDAEPVVITTDGGRARQVIDGLVENAMRVSPTGSAIELRLETTPELCLIVVHDAGPGLAVDDLAVAFDRGVLRDRYRDIRPVGTGLGLSIAFRLVERLGGTMTAANAPGGGAVFSVTLPR